MKDYIVNKCVWGLNFEYVYADDAAAMIGKDSLAVTQIKECIPYLQIWLVILAPLKTNYLYDLTKVSFWNLKLKSSGPGYDEIATIRLIFPP